MATNQFANIRFNYEILKRVNGCQAGKLTDIYPYWDENTVNKYVSFFYQSGYIKTSDGYSVLPTLTVASIKSMLKQTGLATSGKKDDLIQRLKNNIPENEIRALTHGKEIYVFTEQGTKYFDYLKQQLESAEFELHDRMFQLVLLKRFAEAYQLKVDHDRSNVFSNSFSLDRLSSESVHRYCTLMGKVDNREIAALFIVGDMMGYGKHKAKNKMIEFVHKKQLAYSSEEFEEIYERAEYDNSVCLHLEELQSYIESNISHYRVLAASNEQTCKKCLQLDGKIFPIKTAQTGVNLPPFHKGCRCTTVAVFDDKF